MVVASVLEVSHRIGSSSAVVVVACGLEVSHRIGGSFALVVVENSAEPGSGASRRKKIHV